VARSSLPDWTAFKRLALIDKGGNEWEFVEEKAFADSDFDVTVVGGASSKNKSCRQSE
jgi:hypothetical protein